MTKQTSKLAQDQRFTTPLGTLSYPSLSKADNRFKELGEYKANLILPMETAKPLIEKLSAIYQEHTGKAHPKKPDSSNRDAFYYIEKDSDTEEPTGNVVLKLKVANRMKKDGSGLWDRRPKLFDIGGQPINTNKINVGGGSTAKVAFEVYLWTTPAKVPGMSLQPVAVLIDNLVQFGSGAAASDYFDPDDIKEGAGLEYFNDDDDDEDDTVAASTEDDYDL